MTRVISNAKDVLKAINRLEQRASYACLVMLLAILVIIMDVQHAPKDSF
jgi:hypothetical protein